MAPPCGVLALALLLLALRTAAVAGVQAVGTEECSVVGVDGTCVEEQVELAEEQLALGMCTELLQANVVRFRAPSSKESVTKIHASVDPEMTNLSHQEMNLTNSVHTQAVVVSNETAVLSGSLADERAKAEEDARLERQYTEAHSKAETAKQKYAAYLAAVAVAKRRRDQLQNETFMVQRQMERLSGLYAQAAKEYESLLFLMPSMEGINASAAADERQVIQQLRTAGANDAAAKAVVNRDSLQLQMAIEELNRLNDELKGIEGKLERKYKLPSAAAPAAQWGTVIVIGAVSALQQAVELPPR